MNEPDHIFWAKRWKASHDLCRKYSHPGVMVSDVAMSNYADYLMAVFSWLYDQNTLKEKSNG